MGTLQHVANAISEFLHTLFAGTTSLFGGRFGRGAQLPSECPDP